MAKKTGFLDFLREQGVVGLAVGFILGGAVSDLVGSLVENIINPLLAPALGAAEGLDQAAVTVGEISVTYGTFVGAMIDFVVIAAVVYFLVKGLGLDKADKKKD